jgi:hypothetical protein
MTAPFHFPTEYGKLGNWPGSIGPVEAQTIFIEASKMPAGSQLVELGFDGGRTTVALHWAANIAGAHVTSIGVANDQTGLWFRRAQTAFKFKNVTGHESLAPMPCDLIVINPSVSMDLPSVRQWVSMLRKDGIVIRIGARENLGPEFKELAAMQTLAVYQKLYATGGVIKRAIDNVVADLSAPSVVDKNRGPKVRSIRGGKERVRDGNSSDTAVHDAVEPDKGPELLPS